MKHQSRPRSTHLNVRPSRLETDQDLLHDQLDYFRQTDQVPQRHHFSIPEHPPDSETPTSSYLEPVKERVVTRRSRRRPRSNSTSTQSLPFPPAPTLSSSTKSRFATTVKTSTPSRLTPNPNHDASISDQVRARVEAMSIDEIHAAQQEIQDTLKPETIQILKDLWRQRSQATSQLQNTESPTNSSYNIPIVRKRQLLAAPDEIHSRTKPSSSPDVRAELLIPKDQPTSDEEEAKKREWMTEAHEETPSQREVDLLLQQAFENLGDLAKMRFGFDGSILSPEDVENLPTHLGLHHHGSSPASAGYALQDILILMRSTVVSQRIIAMRMFKSVILCHRKKIEHPLIESGILTSVFSHHSADEAFYASITSQSAYLELVEALINAKTNSHAHCDSVNLLYFGSNFYSPCYVSTKNKVLTALADSEIILTLIHIARASALHPEHHAVAKRSLNTVFYLLTHVPDAARTTFRSSPSLRALKSLASGPAENYPVLFMLSCYALAQVTVSLGWSDGELLMNLQRDVVDDLFIQKVSSNLVWLLDSDIQEISVNQGLLANGVLRLIRSALIFQRGIDAFAAVVQMVCRLVRNNVTSTEAFLALEAYAHALFMRANARADGKRGVAFSGIGGTDENDNADENETLHRLSELVPIAISATTYFVDNTAHSDESRAAAGHFAATTFALMSHPVVGDYVIRILNVCSRSTKTLARLTATFSVSSQKIRGLGSISHAGARLLSKIRLEEAFVQRELSILLPASEEERTTIESSSAVSMGQVISNACSEWIALYSRTGSLKKAAELALKIVPCLTDARVIVDLMSRTLLNVNLLRALSPTLTTPMAEKCVKDLLPLAIAELSSMAQPETPEAKIEHISRRISFEYLCRLWVTNVGVFDSFLRVLMAFSESSLIDASEAFECLLRTPKERYSVFTFRVMFNLAKSCVNQNKPLIASSHSTALSSLSTTLNSPVVESVLSLCDYLLSRDPASKVSDQEGEPDFLSSVLLSLMMGFDIDSTLRTAMWKRTVDDCGGALLYQNAVALGGGNTDIGTRLGAELDSMLRLIGVSISDGFLDGERCPDALRKNIFSRIESSLCDRRSPGDVFEVLASCVRNRSLLRERLQRLLRALPVAGTNLNALSNFLSKVSL